MPIVQPSQAIVDLARNLYQEARRANQNDINIFQPGLVREFIIAFQLGHNVNTNKREHDAESRSNPIERYEYLTAFGRSSFQIDRVKSDPNQRTQQLNRITRNHNIILL